MKTINFDTLSSEEFRVLEKSAYIGQLDFNNFPAAEYKYFDKIQSIGYRVRCEGLSRDLAKQECDQARRDYSNDKEYRRHCLEVYDKWQTAIIRREQLVSEIYKAHKPLDKLKLALEFVELTLGEDGFKARNLKYLEGENDDKTRP